MYFVLGKYDKIKELKSLENISEENYSCLKLLTNDDYKQDSSIMIQMIPNLTLDKYSILRDEILKAEQHLLRILNYEFESKTKELYIILVNYADLLEYDLNLIQFSWNLLNDCFEMMTDLLMNKSDTLIIISILYVAYRWRSYYIKFNSNTSDNSNNLFDNKDINFEELLKKLNIYKSDLEELSKKILSRLLQF